MTTAPPRAPGPPDWDGEFAALYADLAERRSHGDVEQARAVQDRIAARLVEAIQGAYAAGCAARAERRDREGFLHLEAALGLHRWTPPGLVLPVSRSDCYRVLGAIYRDWGQPSAVAAATALALRTGESFYKMPHLCQIPILAGLYEQLFGRRVDGCFVEVGAFDGETYGNTAGLADLGWSGLYIEPMPEAFELCRRRHVNNPGVKLLNCAIGPSDGTAELWVAREFSTLSREHIEHGITQGWMSDGAYAQIRVPQRRLATALTQEGIAPGFELLVVDVEGAEEQIFATFDLAHWRPLAIIVELADFAPPGHAIDASRAAVASARRVRALILASGYEAVYADFTNTVFRRSTL